MPNIRLHHLERLLRHPACPLCCAAAIAGIAFLLVSARALPLLGGTLATLVIGGVGPWIAVRGATAVIAWDRRRCRVADTLTATITWRSILPWWRPHVSLSWRDGESGPRSPGSPAPMAAAVTIDSARSVAVMPRRRGRFPRVAPAIESNQPFGVVTASRTLAMPAAVIVWPARGEMRVPAGLIAATGVGQEMSERITGSCGDSIGARDYRDGDSMRSIHWAHTARRDTLVVRERPGAAAAVVRLVVDHRLERIHREAGIHDRTLDAIVTVAFAIIESWLPRGVVFEIIMRRHQIKSTMMTSNRPLKDWGKLIGDVPSASAILDRFLESAEILNFQGRSYRLRNRGRAAEANSKPAKVPTGNPRVKQARTSVKTPIN